MQSRLGRFWFRLLLFAAYVLITGCNKNDMPFPRCISADYFGPEPITVSAYFTNDHAAFIPDDGEIIDSETEEFNNGFHHNQVVRWKDTGLETNGDSLIVRVNGMWTFLNNNNKQKSKSSYSLQDLEQQKYATKFEGEKDDNNLPKFHSVCNDYEPSIHEFSNDPSTSCSVNCKCINEDDSVNTVSGDASCWFTNGNGAYLLFKRPDDDSPNKDLKSMRNPSSTTVHLGYNSVAEGGGGLFVLDRNSTSLKDRNCNIVKLDKGWKIYVKILDRYYLDNVGGYSFEFLGGVQQPSQSGFFDYIYHYLKCVLLINKDCKEYFDSDDPAAAQAMFQNIAEKSMSFHNFVLSLLVLFIVMSSLLYLFGMVQETKHDMLIRMIKITLVIVLISPGSFRFFYDHFLTLFVTGLEQLISIITNFAPNMNTGGNAVIAQGDEVARVKLFSFMEDMFNKFFSYSVWKKLAAFLHHQIWISLLMIPAIFIGIVLYFLLCLYAYIIFLSGFIGIAFLIAIMPLFLISILFSPLKSMFEGWVKFCISFCLQSIMIFALLSLLASIIMNTFYKQLGFTVCYNKWLEIKLRAPKLMGGFFIVDKQFFGWTPGQIFVPYTIGEASPLNVDKDIEGIEKLSRAGGTIKFTSGAGYIPLPPDYIEKGFRYIDYPFFNPIPGTENNPADHYISESDMVVDNGCRAKDLVRLINSLSHASNKADILLLINNIDKNIITNHCQSTTNYTECNKYREIINDYRKDTVESDRKSTIQSLKALMQEIIKKDTSCTLRGFDYVDKKYQENSDYQRVQDIQRGYLINIGEIFILFLFSFLMFSIRAFVQQIGSSIAGGGYSVYNISKMYQASPLAGIAEGFKQQWQNSVGGKLESLGDWATHLPNKLVVGTANLLGRTPVVGGVLKHTIDVPHKLVNATIEATKFAISPKNDVDKLEEKIYRAFGVDVEDITHRRIGRYLDYYKGYVGSHLGYTIEDAMKFTWEHGLDSIGKHGYDHNLLYRAKEYRREFLEKLHDYTIGRKREPEKDKLGQQPGENKLDQPNEVVRKLGTEQEKLIGDNHNQPPEEGKPNQSNELVRKLGTEQEKLIGDNHNQPPEEGKPNQSNELVRNLGTEQEKLIGDNHNQPPEEGKPNQSNELIRNLGTEQEESIGNNHNQPPEEGKPNQSNEVVRNLGTEQEESIGNNHNQSPEEEPNQLRGEGQVDQSSEVARGLDTKLEGPSEIDDKVDQVVQELDTERHVGTHAEEKEKRDLVFTEQKNLDEIDDFGSAFEGMEKRAEREGRRKQNKTYNLSPLFAMNTPEAIKKRTERAARKKERDKEGENYDTSLLSRKDTDRKNNEEPDSRGDNDEE